ncbi:hypothetical protein O6H91_16G070200 [Diphasiastrum complanatum]|uniref:Uncharacterized protein n=1 Tax=Diphasiastrum complanatum TaxID=34168 RepID=A0ACC2BDG6_DIPCM|nr:hypothetical protein O6H91_16G070200 [Diphasiastrum complanatum]
MLKAVKKYKGNLHNFQICNHKVRGSTTNGKNLSQQTMIQGINTMLKAENQINSNELKVVSSKDPTKKLEWKAPGRSASSPFLLLTSMESNNMMRVEEMRYSK